MRRVGLSHGYQLVSLGDVGGQRLLDEYVDARLHQLASDFQMQDGGNGDRHGIDTLRDKLGGGEECAGFEFSRESLRAREVGIGDAGKFDSLRSVGREVAIDAGMVASEGAGADHAYAQCAVLIRHTGIVAHGGASRKIRSAGNVSFEGARLQPCQWMPSNRF